MLIEGYVERVETARKRDAWLLANLIQPHTKEKLYMGMFLGEAKPGQGWNKISEEEYERLMARKKKR